MALTAGTTLGNYEIVAPLGAGGMGEVYRARDLRLRREVALKVLPAEMASDSDRLARFEREARAVAALNHPNIVVLYSVEDAPSVRFLTMELVEGQSLDQQLEPGGLQLERVLDFGIELADALAAAHAKGVIHRDLKPANVMLANDGRIKVLDFGLAKLVESNQEVEASRSTTMTAPLSRHGQVLGTLSYMAPEQVRGEKVDSHSDLFALGIVLFELATGRRPFEGESTADLASAILRDEAPAITTLRPDLPSDLERIVARCLEKDRERRFQTAKDVRNELDLVRGALGAAEQTAGSLEVPSFSGRPAIAVLPFENRSGEPEQEYFSDGLAEDSHRPALPLASLPGDRSTTPASATKAAMPTRERSLASSGVRYVVQGSVPQGRRPCANRGPARGCRHWTERLGPDL